MFIVEDPTVTVQCRTANISNYHMITTTNVIRSLWMVKIKRSIKQTTLLKLDCTNPSVLFLSAVHVQWCLVY